MIYESIESKHFIRSACFQDVSHFPLYRNCFFMFLLFTFPAFLFCLHFFQSARSAIWVTAQHGLCNWGRYSYLWHSIWLKIAKQISNEWAYFANGIPSCWFSFTTAALRLRQLLLNGEAQCVLAIQFQRREESKKKRSFGCLWALVVGFYSLLSFYSLALNPIRLSQSDNRINCAEFPEPYSQHARRHNIPNFHLSTIMRHDLLSKKPKKFKALMLNCKFLYFEIS